MQYILILLHFLLCIYQVEQAKYERDKYLCQNLQPIYPVKKKDVTNIHTHTHIHTCTYSKLIILTGGSIDPLSLRNVRDRYILDAICSNYKFEMK